MNRGTLVADIARGLARPKSTSGSSVPLFVVGSIFVLFGSVRLATAQDDLRNVPDPDPELQLQMLHVQEGFEINLFAAEPMVVKPIQMNWDAQGRLWVAGSTIYPQLKPGEEPNDKIYVLEDTDGDGVADRSIIFAEGLNTPTGILPGDGGVYVANATEVLHLMDTTGDGVADQRRVVLSGFGTADTHHLIHTFRWGPEGMLYFNQSIYIFSHVETPWGVRRMHGGGVWQLRPETLELEPYAYGLVNPWGLQFDKWGQSFLTDGAGSEGINFAFPGAAFMAALGAERIIRGLNPGQPKHSGLEVVSGRHLPEDWDGSLLTNDFRANRVNRFVLTEQGSGYASQEAEPVVWSDHVAFRPVDVTIGPDGAIYVADWYNPIIQHGEVDFRDPRRDRQHGRIWRITAGDRPLVTPPDLEDADIREVLDALKLPEHWTRTQAKQVLKERGAEAVMPALRQWVMELEEPDHELLLLEALWVTQALNVVEEPLLRQLLHADDHRVRAAAVRVLYYWHDRISDAESVLAAAVQDEHAWVRREAVISLRRQVNAEAARSALRALDRSTDDFLDYALWQTIRELEPLWMARIERDPDFLGDTEKTAYALTSVENPAAVRRLVQMYLAGDVPERFHDKVLSSAARWGEVPELTTLFELALEREARREAYLGSLEDAARHQNARPDGDLYRISELLETDQEGVTQRVLRLAGHWNLTELRGRLLDIARDESNSVEVRNAAMDGLAHMEDQESRQLLASMTAPSNPVDLRLMATAKMVAVDLEEAAETVIEVFQDVPEETEVSEVYSAFFSRSEGARALANALENRTIPAAIAQAGMRAMRSGLPWYAQDDHDARALRAAFEASGGALPPERMPQDLNSGQINQLEREVRATADPARGEEIYRRPALMCMNCHAIGGAGGLAGPDLSSLGASAPTDYIIKALVDPNATVKEGYAVIHVVRHDDSVIMGTLMRETSSEIVLRNAGDVEVSIPISQIKEQSISPGSLMPPGLTAQLEREEFIDLVGFLSRLGEVGEYRVSNRRFVRRWRALHASEQVTDLVRERGPEGVVTDNSLQWWPAYSMVSGELPLSDLPEIKPDENMSLAFAFFEVEVQQAGHIGLSFNSTAGLSAWYGQQSLPFEDDRLVADLPRGMHRFTLVVDRAARGDAPLQVELVDPANNPAQARAVGGK